MGKEKLLESSDNHDKSRMGLWSWRPDWLQHFNSIKWFTAALSLSSLTQAITVAGLTMLNLPTLEAEFGLSSKSIGFVMTGNDISALILVTFVSFFGTKASKPKWMGIGSCITGLGVLMFALPKLMIGKYEIIGEGGKNKMAMCMPPMGNSTLTDTCNRNTLADSIGQLAVFFIAQLLMGVGAIPIQTLGPTYLDENVAPRASPMYLGIWFCCTMLGPPLGMLFGSFFLKIYTDIDSPDNIDPKDPRWVGAWWLGYVSFFGLFIINGFFISLFPEHMKSDQTLKRQKSIKVGHLPGEEKIQYSFKGYIISTIRLFKNKVYMLAVLGLTIKMLYTIGLFTFLIKFLVLKFGVNPSKAGQSLGIIMIPSLIVGVMLGSCIVRRLKVEMAAKTAAKVCLIVSIITSFNSFMFMVPGCNNTNLAGVMTPYNNQTFTTDSINSQCNSKCGCNERQYMPLCGSDGRTYHSPCYAGCTTMTFDLSDGVDKMKPIFGNCSCFPSKPKHGNFTSMPQPPPVNFQGMVKDFSMEKLKTLSGQKLAMVKKQFYMIRQTFYNEAIVGKCDRDCKNFYIFMFCTIALVLIGFIGSTPHKIMVLRSVPDNQRAFALGAQFLVMRSVSFLPGPILMGSIIDRNCITWGYNECGDKTSCYDYNIEELSWRVTWFGVITSVIGTVFYFLAWWFYPNSASQITHANLLDDENDNANDNLEM